MKKFGINFLLNSVLLVIFSVAALLLLEAGVRVLFPVYDPSGRVAFQCIDGVYRGSESTPMRQYTNTGEFDYQMRFNQYGLRDSKDLATSSAKDIFVVGDSFSFGQGVEAPFRYSNILDRTLEPKVFNISIPNDLDGYYWLLRYAQAKGATINNIILGLCMENDLLRYGAQIKQCQAPPVSSGGYLSGQSSLSLQPLKVMLLKHSAAYSLVTSIAHQNKSLRQAAIKLGLMYSNEVFTRSPEQYSTEALESSADRVAEIVRDYQALVLIIPSRGLWQGEKQQELRKTHQQFVELLTKRHIHFIDLRPAFEKTGNPLAFHYQQEGHWNAKGHQKAAQEIQKFLRHSLIFSDSND